VKRRPKKKLSGPLRIRFKFPDGTSEEMPLIDFEEQLLRQQHELANSDSPALRQVGEELIRREADRRGREKIVTAKRKQSSELGAKRRRAIGRKTIRRVREAIAAGTNPPVSERHLRRLKKQRK
jgi:hypothetical protein